MHNDRNEVCLADLVLLHGVQEYGKLEPALDVERVAISNGEEMSPERAKDVEDGQADKSSYFVGRSMENCLVAGDEGCVGQDGGLGEASCAAGEVKSSWCRFGGFEVGDKLRISSVVGEEREDAGERRLGVQTADGQLGLVMNKGNGGVDDRVVNKEYIVRRDVTFLGDSKDGRQRFFFSDNEPGLCQLNDTVEFVWRTVGV